MVPSEPHQPSLSIEKVRRRLTDAIWRSGSYDPAVFLLLEDGPAGFGALIRIRSCTRTTLQEDWEPAHLEGAAQVHCDHLVPHLLVHVDESLVPQDTRVGNEDVHRSKCVRRGLDD